MFGRKSEIEQRDRIIAYKNTFGSEQGKAVLFHLMNKFHILNAHDGAPYKEGQRSVVLEIMKHMGVNLEQFDRLMAGEGESR